MQPDEAGRGEDTYCLSSKTSVLVNGYFILAIESEIPGARFWPQL